MEMPSEDTTGQVSFQTRVLKGTVTLTVGQIVTYGASFVRNIIVARILTKADFGIAATFAITIQMLQMISNISGEMLIVQSKRGDGAQFQATAHSFEVLRGLIMGFLLFVLAMAALPVFRIYANATDFWGPLPMTLSWTYLWYAGINVAAFLVYFLLFKPWAQNVTEFLAENAENAEEKEMWEKVKLTDTLVMKEDDK